MSTSTAVVKAETRHASILCVDLDSTLVKTDTLDESIICLIREHASLRFAMPRGYAKAKPISSIVSPPLCRAVLENCH